MSVLLAHKFCSWSEYCCYLCYRELSLPNLFCPGAQNYCKCSPWGLSCPAPISRTNTQLIGTFALKSPLGRPPFQHCADNWMGTACTLRSVPSMAHGLPSTFVVFVIIVDMNLLFPTSLTYFPNTPLPPLSCTSCNINTKISIAYFKNVSLAFCF